MHLTREQARDLDRRLIEQAGVPGVVLMENAGRGCAELLLRLGVKGPVVVCCGKGNNGGDGFVIARWLDNVGVAVRVLLFARPEELAGDAAVMYRIIAHSGPPIGVYAGTTVDEAALRKELDAAGWVVDALFGTGLTGPVRPPFDAIIGAINASRARSSPWTSRRDSTPTRAGRTAPRSGASHRDHRGGQGGIRPAGGGGMAGTGPRHRHGCAAADGSVGTPSAPTLVEV